MFGWARTMCKYGDYYLYLDIDDEMGVTNVIPLPVREMEREEGMERAERAREVTEQSVNSEPV